MREVMNISLPKETVKMIKEEVKKGGFVSVSEFMRHVIRLWHTEKMMGEIKESEKEYSEGKGKELKSLSEM